jgi:urease accessory protein
MNLPAHTALFTPSWHAELELAYGRFGDSTRPTQRRHKGPLRVQKHLYAEGPQVCQHIIVHPPGGIAGGDRLDINASVGANAWAQLTSPGAAKWYRAAGPAYQQLELNVASGGTLEWLPQETIVFSEAKAELTTRINLEGDARLFYWERRQAVVARAPAHRGQRRAARLTDRPGWQTGICHVDRDRRG